MGEALKTKMLSFVKNIYVFRSCLHLSPSQYLVGEYEIIF